jgi:hypothetical protein
MVRSVERWWNGLMGQGGRRGGPGVGALAPLVAAVLAAGCNTTNNYYIQGSVESADAGSEPPPVGERDDDPSAGEPDADGDEAPVGGLGEGNERPPLTGAGGSLSPLGHDAGTVVALSEGAPPADVAASELVVDVFGALGNRYWFEASEEQVERMNAPYGGGLGGGGFFYGDFYTPQGGAGGVTFVDHLLVTSAGEAPHTADFGKVQVRLVGQSTGRPWTEESLPNFKIDADEFTDGNRIGEVKHLRLNNAVVGSIYREKLAFDLYRALGYAAPRTNYAWVSGSVWGPDVDVPYVVVEAYKPQFCKLREAELGGGCVNMWEFYGDLGTGMLGFAESCQFSSCEPTRGLEFEELVISTPQGEGYKAALAEYLDWDAFHRFQCLSWILETGDDALHNYNNVVLVERADGMFQLLPYSVDISLGQEWYSQVPLPGSSTLAVGCQSDSVCWADTIATCEVLVDEFAAIDPVGMLDAVQAQLEQAGMLRSGDDGRYDSLRRHLEQRIAALPEELEQNRELPVIDYCYPYVDCAGFCVLPGECVLCEPPPAVDPGVGQPTPAADAGVAPEEPPPPDDGQVCVPPIQLYDAVAR